jgi:plastocyanin
MQWKVPSLMLSVAAIGLATMPVRRAEPVVHEVRMTTDGKNFTFSPAALTIKSGDEVRFINVSGGPHNVAFDPAKVADPAAAKLAAAMKNQIAPMAGPLLTSENESYVVSFAGVPAGKYEFFCMPHSAMAMKGVIVVE